MPTNARTPSLEVRSALVAAAVRLLERDGPDALSVRRIAAEASVAPMCIYSRFGSKDGIVDELFVDGFDDLAARVRAIDAADPVAALHECGRCYWAFAMARPATYAVMFDRTVAGYEPSDDAKAHAHDCFGALVTHVAHAIDAGVLDPADPVDVAQQLWAAMHGIVSLTHRGLGFVDDVDGFLERFVQTVLRGLAPAPG